MSDKRQTDAETAWQATLDQPNSRWMKALPRFDQPVVDLDLRPKFALARDDRFFCIGSCFARNIEEKLIAAEVEVLSKRLVSPKAEYPNRPSGVVNKFTTHSIRNEIEWLADRPTIDADFFEERPKGWSDLQLSPGVRPVPLERAIARRNYMIDDYFSRIRNASVLIMTLGLNEVWYDTALGRYLNASPSIYGTRREPDRYRFEITDVDENVRELEGIAERMFALNPKARIIVTVSPVPMTQTFSGRDVIIANSLSKSTLRAAADAICAAHPAIDYFPSYEMITGSVRNEVFLPDHRHVTDDAVGVVIGRFLHAYMGIEVPETDFVETAYLGANPDVEEAVRSSEFESGYQHWVRHGRSEGRPLQPAE